MSEEQQVTQQVVENQVIEGVSRSTARQVMEVATKIATWATIALLGFFVSTVMSLDKNYGIMAKAVEEGFISVNEKLVRIEKRQDDHSKKIATHGSKLAAIEANRFTDEDSRDLLASFAEATASLDTKIQDIWKAIADIRERIPYDIVKRLEEDVRGLQANSDRIKERLSDHTHDK